MNHVIINHTFHYETGNLIREFYPREKVEITNERNGEDRYIISSNEKDKNGVKVFIEVCLDGQDKTGEEYFPFSEMTADDTEDSFCERKTAIVLFNLLCDITGYTPPWGILTGVRPAKLMNTLIKNHGEAFALEYFSKELLVKDEKITLAHMVALEEEPIMSSSTPNSFSLYVSVPFCPTRCSYCSFVSHSNDKAKKLIPTYIDYLCKEIEYTAALSKKLGLSLESVYIGGGTPTVLTAEQLKRVTDTLSENFDITDKTEYTIEAGRPDSITPEKLDVIKNCGAQRISINPQTFNDSVLEEIGRKHTSAQTCEAMELAQTMDFGCINMDLIAGLPKDTLESFKVSLDKAIDFGARNITVHTLALKRASTLVTCDRERGDAQTAEKMLSYAFSRLTESGYVPYYMYRQSKCLGNAENVGWTKRGYECKYNIYMMEETHTVLAVGAGAVIKLRNPYTTEIERIFNYKYPYEYIDGFDVLLERKNRITEFYESLPVS